MRLAKEAFPDQKVTALGRGRGGEALAGLADGRICRVDPATLELAERAKLPSQPKWIIWSEGVGNRPAGLVAVAELWGEDGPASVVHDLVAGTEIRRLG